MLRPQDLGFTPVSDDPPAWCWRDEAQGSALLLRALRSYDDLLVIERLQREIFGVDDRNLSPASQLVVVPETGGEVIGAWQCDGSDPNADDPDAILGWTVAWGGYVNGRPLVVSDQMGVVPAARRRGLALQLKRLQAGMFWERGYRQIVWTVDPLRATNAALNIVRLGATSHRYEINRYGEAFGEGLYGRLPSDRLHMDWDLARPEVQARLRGQRVEMAWRDDIAAWPPGNDVRRVANRVAVPIPADIDTLMHDDPESGLRWRLWLREVLPAAFADGWVITGFVPAPVPLRVPEGLLAPQGMAAYILTR